MLVLLWMSAFVFFFKQKTAYEMRISDWSSDVCSSDLRGQRVEQLGMARGAMEHRGHLGRPLEAAHAHIFAGVAVLKIVVVVVFGQEIGRASCRERVCQYV